MAFYSGGSKQSHADTTADIASLHTDIQIHNRNIHIEF